MASSGGSGAPRPSSTNGAKVATESLGVTPIRGARSRLSDSWSRSARGSRSTRTDVVSERVPMLARTRTRPSPSAASRWSGASAATPVLGVVTMVIVGV